MITFFRRIRQQLLNENKTNKYLKYAIGEDILVTIGMFENFLDKFLYLHLKQFEEIENDKFNADRIINITKPNNKC